MNYAGILSQFNTALAFFVHPYVTTDSTRTFDSPETCTLADGKILLMWRDGTQVLQVIYPSIEAFHTQDYMKDNLTPTVVYDLAPNAGGVVGHPYVAPNGELQCVITTKDTTNSNNKGLILYSALGDGSDWALKTTLWDTTYGATSEGGDWDSLAVLVNNGRIIIGINRAYLGVVWGWHAVIITSDNNGASFTDRYVDGRVNYYEAWLGTITPYKGQLYAVEQVGAGSYWKTSTDNGDTWASCGSQIYYTSLHVSNDGTKLWDFYGGLAHDSFVYSTEVASVTSLDDFTLVEDYLNHSEDIYVLCNMVTHFSACALYSAKDGNLRISKVDGF